MFAICIESSHSKGMGHLFRMLNFAKYLKKKGEEFLFVINNNDETKYILNLNGILFEEVDLKNLEVHWEERIIEKYNITFWVNDRLETDKKHSQNIKNKYVKLITLDDLGSGAELSDVHICGLFFNKQGLKGKKIFQGIKYLILNDEIDKYKKERSSLKKILVSLGGSDTYGVTITILKILKEYNIHATIHTGASFIYNKELRKELTKDYQHITFVSSFISECSKYDLAITGGGVTPFEANASGLPCLIVASEKFEVDNGRYLDTLGSSVFLGFRDNIKKRCFSDIKQLNLEKMSQIGLQAITTEGAANIYDAIRLY